jgi:hypothetical protein
MKGSHFESLEDIQGNLITTLKGLLENGFQQCFQAQQRCWNWNTCKISEGKYFEGDPEG